MKNKIKTVLPYFVIYGVILAILLIQHNVISLYFDDFGNASLSYAHTTENVIGTNFNFVQLWDSIVYTYFNFGGRVFYGMLASLLLKDSIKFFMIPQAFVITGIIYFLSQIIGFIVKKKSPLIPLVCFILYMLFDISILRHGTYWASASILYVWPMLPFFAFVNYYIRSMDKIKNNEKVNYIKYIVLNTLLLFLTLFSQEQIGAAMIPFIIIYIIFDHIKEIKKYLKYDLFTIIWSGIVYGALFFAPGNWKRMETNVEFANYSFFEKIYHNIPKICDLLFKVKTSYFINILAVILLIITITFIIKKSTSKKEKILLSIPSIAMIINLIYFYYNNYSNILLLTLVGCYVLINLFILLLKYYINKKQIKMIAYPIGAMCSVACLVMAPYAPERSAIPCIFIMFIVIITLGIDVYRQNNVTKTLIIIMIVICGFFGLKNTAIIYLGYRTNYAINESNYHKLANYENNIDADNILYLCRVPNSIYGSTQPYEASFDYWIQQYYDIPVNIQFDWGDCN